MNDFTTQEADFQLNDVYSLIGLVNTPVVKIVIKGGLRQRFGLLMPSMVQAVVDIVTYNEIDQPQFPPNWKQISLLAIDNAQFKGPLLDHKTIIGQPILFFTMTTGFRSAKHNFVWISSPTPFFWDNPVSNPCPTWVMKRENVSLP